MTCTLDPSARPLFGGYDSLDRAMLEAFGLNAPLFFLGAHQPGWLNHVGLPLFVSDVRLRVYKTLPVAAAPWACDSGGFSELQHNGTWTISPREYVARLCRYRDEIGQLLWAAPQDWMCEPIVINGGWAGRQYFVGTHLTVHEHQWRTVRNYLHLRDIAPDLPIIPVVQGFTRDEYLRCVDLYWDLGRLDLTTEPLVGVGSVCRRQAMSEAGDILTALHQRGLHRLHGFGFKILGLTDYGHLLSSADSMAWSDDARKLRRPAPGCPGKIRRPGEPVKNCANCLHYAVNWRLEVLAAAAARQAEGRAA
jgi:hypothetical protein